MILPLGALLGAGLAVGLRTSSLKQANIDFGRLTDTHGHLGKPADFDGRYLLVSFGYTSCPDVCPLTLLAIHSALRRLGPAAADLVPVFITVDPQRDTPERLGTYVSAFDPRIRGFTGSTATIASTAEAFHVDYRSVPATGSEAAGRPYTVEHSALLFLVDPRHRVVATIPESLPEADLSRRIVEKFEAARRG